MMMSQDIHEFDDTDLLIIETECAKQLSCTLPSLKEQQTQKKMTQHRISEPTTWLDQKNKKVLKSSFSCHEMKHLQMKSFREKQRRIELNNEFDALNEVLNENQQNMKRTRLAILKCAIQEIHHLREQQAKFHQQQQLYIQHQQQNPPLTVDLDQYRHHQQDSFCIDGEEQASAFDYPVHYPN